MPSKASHRRYVVVLNAPRSPSAFIVFGNHVVARMTGNSWFPRPVPALSTVEAALADAQTAQAATLTRSKATRTARDIAVAAAFRLLKQLASYVQQIADANVEASLAIIQSSGFSAKRSSGSRAHVLGVEQDGPSGSARVTVPVAGDGATYFWQMSLDGGRTWIDLPSTKRSTKSVANLAPGTTVLFRYKTLTRKGESDWSAPIPYFVV